MKKKFYRTKFFMFISLTLIPLCFVGIISICFINLRLRKEAENRAMSTAKLIEQTFQELVSSLEYYRITIDSNVNLQIALIRAFQNSADAAALQMAEQSMQNIYYSLSAKPYIQSIYVTAEGSSCFINGISHEYFSGSTDKDWADIMWDRPESTYIQVRDIRKNKFDSGTYPVVTIYQKIKYNELIAINVRQDYFNHWLDSIINYDGQALMVSSPDGRLLFYNQNTSYLTAENLELALSSSSSASSLTLTHNYYINSGEIPGIYGFRYISMIPYDKVMELPHLIMLMLIAAAVMSVLVSSVLAYIFTRKDYQQIYQIIELFDRVERGEAIPQAQESDVPTSPYFHIINNIIRLFLSQTYLKLQLDAQKYALSTAQLSALQYQLNPHFLFNTLQNIDLEILKISRRPTSANHMITALSSLLRYSLNEPTQSVSVREEISQSKNYISLQSCKFGDRFTVSWEYEEEVLDHTMLRLLLQPVIENSLTHSGFTSEKKLWIKIKIQLKDNSLFFFIIDNGYGIPGATLKELQASLMDDQVDTSGRHIGLKNISQRVRLAFPDGYVRIKSKEGWGTIVEIAMINHTE